MPYVPRTVGHSRLRRTEEAIGCCTEALEATAATAARASQPEHASFFHALLGESLAAASHPLRAARSFRRAAALQPYATHGSNPRPAEPTRYPLRHTGLEPWTGRQGPRQVLFCYSHV